MLAKIVDHAGHERSLGSHNRQRNIMGLCKGDQGREVQRIDGHILDAGLGRGAGIARSHIDFSRLGGLLHAPGDCVFAAAVANDQYIHKISCVLPVLSVQWRKCRTPVKTMAMSASSAAAITSSSRMEPPG